MIPFNRISVVTSPEDFLNPWSPGFLTSFQWGPVGIQDPSQGLLVKIWEAYTEGPNVYIRSETDPPFLYYTHTHVILRISLAFNQNGDPHIAFFDTQQLSYLYWFNGLTSSMTLTQWPEGYIGPCVTLDDAREFNIPSSDVVFAYIRAGLLRYRLQRDRFDIEYTPTVGEDGPFVEAGDLYHVSMQTNYVVGFLLAGPPPYLVAPANIMKKAIINQKAPVEVIDVVYNYQSLTMFNDPIEAARSTIVVATGTDESPEAMLVGDPTFSGHLATQKIQGGIVGNVYRLAICVRTEGACIYVIEGDIYVNDSPAEAPEEP